MANAIAERWVGTLRRELIDRTIIWNRHQLDRLVIDYIDYYNHHRPHRSVHYNHHRPHRSLRQQPPAPPTEDAPPAEEVTRITRCGALIHEYRPAA